MSDHLYNIVEPLSWLVLGAGWLVVGVVAVNRLGGKGGWLLFAGTVAGLLSQLPWIASALIGDFAWDWAREYGSWPWIAMSFLSLLAYAVLGVAVLMIVGEAAGRKNRLVELERMIGEENHHQPGGSR